MRASVASTDETLLTATSKRSPTAATRDEKIKSAVRKSADTAERG